MRRRECGIVRDGGRRQLRLSPEPWAKSPVASAVAALRVQYAHPKSAAAQAAKRPATRQVTTGLDGG